MVAVIGPARDARDLDDARALIRAYARASDFEHCFTDLERELAALPGPYAPPRGALLLAREDGVVHGCVALRPSTRGACELERLYVTPEARGTGLGRALAEAALARARELGCRAVSLRTLETMREARALYASLGFTGGPDGRTDRGAAVWALRLELA